LAPAVPYVIEGLKDLVTAGFLLWAALAKPHHKITVQPKWKGGYPGDDPTKPPGPHWEWRGKGPVGSKEGSWVPKEPTGEHEGISYIRSRLSQGTTLSEELLRLPLEEGRVFAYLPEGIDRSEIAIEYGVANMSADAGRQRDEKLVGFVSSFLASSLRGYAIFEDLINRPGSPFLSDVSYFVFESNDYPFVDSASDNELILRTIRKAGHYPFIGVLTEAVDEPPIRNKQEISLETVQLLGRNAKHIVVGAYDMEAYLIWSRSG
jgi:hypothetical protein